MQVVKAVDGICWFTFCLNRNGITRERCLSPMESGIPVDETCSLELIWGLKRGYSLFSLLLGKKIGRIFFDAPLSGCEWICRSCS